MTVHEQKIHPFAMARNRKRVTRREAGSIRRVTEIGASATIINVEHRIVFHVRHPIIGTIVQAGRGDGAGIRKANTL